MMAGDTIEQVALEVFSGEAVLFAGSGFSSAAINKEGKALPIARDLIEIMGSELGEDTSGYALEVVSEHYLLQRGQPALYHLLSQNFFADRVSEAQIALLSLPWRRIYTTNFDNVCEQALVANARQPITFDLDHDALKPIPKNTIVHLNGAIATANEANFREKIRLTTSTYFDNRIEESGWGRRFLRDVSHARALVFVGYSLFDIDIGKLLRENPQLRSKTYFVESTRDDKIKFSKLRGFGEVLPIGMDQFVNFARGFSPPPGSPPDYFVAFDVVAAPEEMKVISADDLRNFYISGKYSWEISFQAEAERGQIIAPRHKLASVLQDLKNGVVRFVVHSKLGNGKTFFLHLLSADLMSAGYQVFWFHQPVENIGRELEAIKNCQQPAIILESVFGNEESVQVISENLGAAVPIFVTCRTAAFDLRNTALGQMLGGTFVEVSLNNLTEREREALVHSFNAAGFWGEHAAERDDKKSQLVFNWGNELRAVLLKLFSETDLKDRIKRHLDDGISKDKQLKKLIILAFLLKVAESRAEFDVFDDLLGGSSYPIFKRHEEIIKDYFDVTANYVSMRSSVLGEYCLRYIFDDEDVISVLMEVATVQSRDGHWTDDIWTILKSFMRYGFVEPLLTSGRKRALLLQYYEHLRQQKAFIRRPLFWLQYAIAEMAVNRYEPAKTFLDTAKSYALKIPGFKTNQIDNHYARYLLESRARSNGYSDYAAAFYKASGLLAKEIASEGTSYYTARVVRYVAEYFKKAIANLDKNEKEECLRRLLGIERALKAKMAEFKSPHPRFEEAIRAISQANTILNGGDTDIFVIGHADDFVLD